MDRLYPSEPFFSVYIYVNSMRQIYAILIDFHLISQSDDRILVFFYLFILHRDAAKVARSYVENSVGPVERHWRVQNSRLIEYR